MAQLKCENLSLGYDGVEIISGLSFEVNKGDYLCIIGENGSGKTTLMKTILGLKQPISGKVVFSDGLKKSGVGYLPQQTQVQRDFPASVKEIVLSGCQNRMGLRPFYGKEEKALADESIERMGLSELKNKCYRELSGGQQQRVLLARALCAAKDILLLDEPVAGLDPKVTADMYSLIYDLNKNDNTTIIMISHDIQAAVKYADKILHIGDSVFFGTKDEFLAENNAPDFGKGDRDD
jgi:zinc transport system ATP-binding protein